MRVEVESLPADERYPDSCFVEDPAVLTGKCAIITNPGAPSRNGEKDEILSAVSKYYTEDRNERIHFPGTLEGGEVMMVGGHFYVGRSERTNEEGIRQHREILRKLRKDGCTILKQIRHSPLFHFQFSASPYPGSISIMKQIHPGFIRLQQDQSVFRRRCRPRFRS